MFGGVADAFMVSLQPPPYVDVEVICIIKVNPDGDGDVESFWNHTYTRTTANATAYLSDRSGGDITCSADGYAAGGLDLSGQTCCTICPVYPAAPCHSCKGPRSQLAAKQHADNLSRVSRAARLRVRLP